MRTDAFETLGRPRSGCIVYTCEHASNRVPRPLQATAADRALLAMHWGYDIGAAWITRRLARGDVAVLSRTSRLVLDVNRAPDDPTLILADTHDGPVSFNQSLTEATIAARVARYHAPLHAEIARIVQRVRPRLLVSIHTFTPSWRGVPREIEAGVLFDDHDVIALNLVDELRATGWRTEPNEPYSGKVGLIYSAARHGSAAEVPYLEIEVRQDLVNTRPRAEAAAERIRSALRRGGW